MSPPLGSLRFPDQLFLMRVGSGLIDTPGCDMTSVFYFGSPQYNEDEGELYAVDTDGMVDQREELGSFLLNDVAVRQEPWFP